MHHKTLLATLAAVTALAWTPASAQFAKPEDAVKYRKAGMTLLGAHFGRLVAMTQGKMPYDAAQAAANADVVLMMSKLPFTGFVDGTSSKDKGGAKAEIWTQRAKFDDATKKMQDEIVKLAAAAKAGGLPALSGPVGEVGKTCKGCHDDFRNQ